MTKTITLENNSNGQKIEVEHVERCFELGDDVRVDFAEDSEAAERFGKHKWFRNHSIVE